MKDLEQDIREPFCYLRNTVAYKEIEGNEVVDYKDLYLASDGTLVSINFLQRSLK